MAMLLSLQKSSKLELNFASVDIIDIFEKVPVLLQSKYLTNPSVPSY